MKIAYISCERKLIDMKKRKLLGLVVATMISISASGCYFLPDEEKIIDPPTVKASETNYTTITAKKKDLVRQIVTSGTIVSQSQNDLSFDRDGVVGEVNIKAGEAVKKGDILCTLDTGDLDYLIKEKELYIKRAELNVKVLREQGASQAEIDRQLVDKEILEHEITTLYEEKDAMVITAPEDGVVVTVNVKAGDWAQNGVPVMTLIDPDSVYVAIAPEDIKEFKMDAAMSIKMNGELYDAVVFMTPDNIPAEDEESEYDIDFDKNRIYIKFKDNPPENCVNVLVDTILVLDKREDVVVVANNIIKTVNGEKVVYLLKDGKKVASKVEIGLQTGSQSEIISGVNAGDEIVIR